MASRIGRKGKFCKALLVGACLFPLAGCVVTESFIDTLPVVAPVTRPNFTLRQLPPPESKTVVAVYELEDLTGQFKERENVQSLSRAVTQGGAAILIKALQDAGERRWFTVLERAELENLLKERQIVTEMRRLYRNETTIDPKVLPPLLHASIIVEGAIIGYDTNIVTGGAGARYLGIGADTKYIQDVVTVTLRAVSTKTGEVLTSVTSRKAVASYSLQGGAFLFIKLDELFEAEAGTTYNEPKQIAVQSAVENAVTSLIIEGAELGIWSFADRAAGRVFVENYRNAKYGPALTAAAQFPPSPETANPSDIAETVPQRPRPVQVTQRRIQPQASAASPASRVVTQPPAQPAVRRVVPGVTQVPGGPAPATTPPPVQRQPEEQPPRQLPPAPAPDEPAVGSNGRATPESHKVAEAG